MRFALLSLVAVVALNVGGAVVNAHERLVFISSFAPADQGAITAYQLDLTTGHLKLSHQSRGAEHPFYLAISPNQRFLYAIYAKTFGGKDHEQVAAYEIIDRQGQLKLLNRQSARGSAACYLDVDATGKVVLVANYLTGSVATLPTNDDGALGEAASYFQHRGSSVDPKRQAGPHAHCIVVSPNNRFAYVADLGLDQILIYHLDPAKAELSPARPPFVKTAPGAGPRHLTFHPNGKLVYVINELANSVSVFDFDAVSGGLAAKQTIATLPKEFAGTSTCADLKITPDGRFLFATNRGHDSIAAYRIDADGRLSLIAIEPSLGKGPQNLAITEEGKLLLCANLSGNSVAVFRIDGQTGRLTSVGLPTSITSPSCIRILRKL